MEPFSQQRWDRIEALFDRALDLDSDARAALLDEACADDPALRRDVERLLRAEAEAPAFLDGLAADHVGALVREASGDADRPPEAGRRIGPYRVAREVGRGGMGAVFLAERADGAFQQTVALKLLRPGLDTDDAARRFRAERQILASLHHPHIARLLDGGVTDDGRPYLAMEYVEGQPIDAYCDARKLAIEARLRLFITVGDAVHHAHRNLVVHRDLKPSNIIVTDGGEVRLLDFGIAKLLDDEGTPMTVPVTQPGQRWMTPEYAAPEQIAGAPITTATDVYQLGVVLYELLTGHRPFDRNGGGVRAVEEAVLEAVPEKPSAAVSRVTEHPTGAARVDAETVSRARATEPERLRKALRGDLDTICLKALAKAPEARYASAEAFVEDVKRYLAGLPVQARPPTVGYRVRRFVGRHRAGVAATMLVALSLVGGLGAALWQARVARAERDEAEALAVFLEDLLAAGDPFAVERLDTLRVQDLVARGRAQVETELVNRPVLQARMLTTLGGAYVGMQHFDDAEAVLERALALRRRHLGMDHEATAATLVGLARARASRDGDSTVVALLREALAIQRARLGDDDPETAMTRARLARALTATETPRAYEQADALLRRALQATRASYPEMHRQTVYLYTLLADLRRATGAIEEAATLQWRALDMSQTIYGRRHPQTARIQSILGIILLQAGHLEEAERHLRAALAVERPLFTDQHPNVQSTLTYLASALRQQGRYGEAAVVLREVVPAIAEPLPRAIALGTLATVLWEQGDLAGATRAQGEAVALAREGLGAAHPMLAYSTGKLADILTQRQRYAEAERVLLEGLRPFQVASGEYDAAAQPLLQKTVALYESTGQIERAMRYRAHLVEAVESARVIHPRP